MVNRISEEIFIPETLNLSDKNVPSDYAPAPFLKEAVDIFDDADSGDGLFSLLDPLPSTETTETGITIKVRDMNLSRLSKGRTPKLLLHELVLKSDKKAKILYKDIAKASRAKRASVAIQWSSTIDKMQSWTMDDVACYDLLQAEIVIGRISR